MMVVLRKSSCPFGLRAKQPPSFHGTQFLLGRSSDRQTGFLILGYLANLYLKVKEFILSLQRKSNNIF